MELGNIKESRNIIEEIVPGSIAEELELEPGDILLSINDTLVNDIIDYKYLVSDDMLVVEIQKPDGEVWELEIEKDYNEDLGIIFTNPLIDKAKSCRNNCLFCFIDQLPPNMRETLYFKDDDSRLSFLQGNFITLTNMSDDEISRIIKYRLSPINISVHTTNPELRVKMLNNKNAGKVYEILKRFHEANLEVNCQIVLVPEVNDGDELKRTIEDLSKLFPTVESVAIVPIGLTKYRDGLVKVKPFDKEHSEKMLDEVNIMQEEFLEKLQTRFVFPSDEFYCVAKRTLPSSEEYEGYPQLENGVGLMKSFEEEIMDELSKINDTIKMNKRYIMATGTLASFFIKEMSNRIMEKFEGLELEVVPIKNEFFGETITVAGLVTGIDLVTQLKQYKDYDGIIIPRSMLKRDELVFLDNITLEGASESLGMKITPCNVDGVDLINFLKIGVTK